MDIDEQVAIFLHIIAHNDKNQVMICRFHRSGDTISRYVSRVCNVVIRLHSRFHKEPEPVPENSTDHKWKWFKNCLGALDRTHIKCLVPSEENRSAVDGRVLRDAHHRPHGLKVSRPGYYLVDVGYTNGEGFLAPYSG
ncbi:uncharacterized protein LOC143538477 [Bidens hawaiensis]|uniref:uncharacterized protein LOC143538477 n=1 Tax=Bidens hawaiensis TaxID=980011 RepID=UPI00404AE56D